MINYLWPIYFLFNVIHGLRWNSSGYECNKEMIISLASSVSNIKLDLYQKEQIVVLRDLNQRSTQIHVYCFIAGYNEKSEYTFSFCKDNHCMISQKDDNFERPFNQYNMIIKVLTKFENRKGMKVEIELPSGDKDVSGNYYCNVMENNGKFSIRSNNIQIRDIIYWEENLVTNMENTITRIPYVVTKARLPIVFKCSNNLDFSKTKPEWIAQEFASPVFWSVCPILKNFDSLTAEQKVTFSHCVSYTTSKWRGMDVLEPKDISEMTSWSSYVNQEGELIIFDITHTSDITYALMCYRKSKNLAVPINTHLTNYSGNNYIVKGIEFDSTIVNENISLSSISPKISDVNIYARQVLSNALRLKMKIAIYAKYSAPNTADVKWYFDGYKLNERANLKIDSYKVTFIGDIKADLAGNYTLVVKDQDKTLSITKIVNVLGSPTIKDSKCMPELHHVMEGGNVSLICDYEDYPDELDFLINNLKVKSNDELAKSDLRKDYPYLADFNFSISAIKNKTSNVWTLKYSAFQLRRTKGHTKYQDHSITFFVKNKYGLSIHSTSIYVVPNVESQILEFPHALNCTPFCKSSERHNFKCRFNENEYKNKELYVDHYWNMNAYRLDKNDSVDNSFSPYFKVNPQTKDLELMEINSSNFKRDAMVKDVLRSTSLECRIELKYHFESELKSLYYSNLDKDIADKLTVKLMFDVQPSSAYVTWIIIVILVLIISIIVIAVIYNHRKAPGDTYLLEKNEIKVGHNREKELEKETFKPYQYKNKHLDTDSIHSDVEFNTEANDYKV